MPSSRFAVSESGSGRTRAIAAHSATVTAVWTARLRRRRPEPSARVPDSGASSAMSTPAAVRPQPSQVECRASAASSASPPAATTAGSTNASLVSQRVNTNVVMTALNAAEPQSHRDQATTRPRAPGAGAAAAGASAPCAAGPGVGGPAGVGGSGAGSACTRQAYRHRASRACRTPEHAATRAGASPVRSGCRARGACLRSGHDRDRPHRHLLVAVRAVARGVLPPGPAAAPRARARQPPPRHHRDQRLLLRAAAPRVVPGVARRGPGGLRVLRQRRPVRHAHEEARRRRGAAGQLLRLRGARAGPGARAGAVAAPADARLRPGPAGAVLRPAAADDERLDDRAFTTTDADRPLRHVLEVRHASYETPEFPALLREHGIGLVVADTAGRWPYLEDVTSDLVYVRLHGDSELYVSGYDDPALDRWAARVRAWAAGGEPADARRLGPPAPAAPEGRDVYVYFDNDAKVRAPVDAMALAARLGVGPLAARA